MLYLRLKKFFSFYFPGYRDDLQKVQDVIFRHGEDSCVPTQETQIGSCEKKARGIKELFDRSKQVSADSWGE